MSYNSHFMTPRFTQADANRFNLLFPGVNTIATIPLVEDAKEAEKQALRVMNKSLTRYEYVDTATLVKETDEGWLFLLHICGD